MALYANTRFRTFRDKLEEAGFTLQVLWEGRTYKRDTLDVCLLHVIGSGKRPAVATIVVQDYGDDDGFGIWFESGSASIEGDIQRIAGD